MHRSWVEISRDALRANVSTLRRFIGPELIFLAVVKANAYGHGIREVATILKKDVAFRGRGLAPLDASHASYPTGWFGVDSISEAVTLRDIGIRAPIVILGYVPIADARLAVRIGARVTVAAPENVRALSAAARSLRRTAVVHVELETGTQRQGVTAAELPAFLRLIRQSSNVDVEAVATHLADIEDAGSGGFAAMQIERFEHLAEIVEHTLGASVLRHVAASEAALIIPSARYDIVRFGIALYGLWPSERIRASAGRRGSRLALRPALAWKTIVGPMHEVPRGAPVGYGCSECVRRRTRLAVLPIGYWDGYDRKLSSVGGVLIRGRRCKVIGRVCMNMIMVDVTDVPRVRLEDEVVLLGGQRREEVSADELARKIGTINYEVVTRINPMLPRRIV
ncbi:MAG: alanine racemase [Candidatus Uhrbacteria bacterium]